MSTINLDPLDEQMQRTFFGEGVADWTIATPEAMTFAMMGCHDLSHYEGDIVVQAADFVSRLYASLFDFLKACPTLNREFAAEATCIYLRVILTGFKVLHRNGLWEALVKLPIDSNGAPVDVALDALREKRDAMPLGYWKDVPTQEGTLLAVSFERLSQPLFLDECSALEAMLVLSCCVHLIETASAA